MQIHGSVALVTGANRGLGLRLTEELVRRGAAKVYAAARNPAQVTTPGVLPLRLDITDAESVAAAVGAAPDVTLLVNNAGTYNGATLLEGSLADVRALMETHFFGTLSVTRAFAPTLIANTPSAILNINSVLSWLHPGALGAYAAAKTALWGQTDAVRAELEDKGVGVTALHVGFMDTDMVAGIDAAKSDPAAVAAAALDGVEQGAYEVLADDITRHVKNSLAQDRGTV
jgi:NAD(P)-dependent dehydrogenase (short-subunit alcohol dehydrogenase family)